VRDAGDAMVEAASEGTDRIDIFVSTAFTVGDDIEIIEGVAVGGVTVTGGATDNTINGYSLADVLSGGGGNDTLSGGANGDTLFGGNGNDSLFGGTGGDTLDGGTGDDRVHIASSSAIDVSLDSAGTVVVTGDGTETLIGIESLSVGSGHDTLTGDGGANLLFAGFGDDTVFGSNGGDLLAGQDGNDTVFGGGGGDTIIGGDGSDTFTGGTGADTFVYSGGGLGTDTISDFADGGDADRVLLQNGVIVSSGLGSTVAVLSDGTSLVATNGHNWIAGDFI